MRKSMDDLSKGIYAVCINSDVDRNLKSHSVYLLLGQCGDKVYYEGEHPTGGNKFQGAAYKWQFEVIEEQDWTVKSLIDLAPNLTKGQVYYVSYAVGGVYHKSDYRIHNDRQKLQYYPTSAFTRAEPTQDSFVDNSKITLDDIFNKQIELNKRCVPDLYSLIEDPEEKRKWYLNFKLSLDQEIAESIDSLSWKWWKKQEDNWDNVKIELIDMLHFWVSMCTIAGMDANDVTSLYMKKNKLNHTRQDGGYKEGTYLKIDANGVEDNEKLQ